MFNFCFSNCIQNKKKKNVLHHPIPHVSAENLFGRIRWTIWRYFYLRFTNLCPAQWIISDKGPMNNDELYRRIKRGTYQIKNQKVNHKNLDLLQICLNTNDDTRASAKNLMEHPWFKIENIKQKVRLFACSRRITIKIRARKTIRSRRRTKRESNGLAEIISDQG